MSNLSIFDKKWIEVVFEGKNQEYGAYQLRQENEKITFRAFGLGIVLVLSGVGIFTLSSFFTANDVAIPEPEISVKVNISSIKPPHEAKIEPIVNQQKAIKSFSYKTILVNPIVSKPINANNNLADSKDIGKISNNVSPIVSGNPTDVPINGTNINVVIAKQSPNDVFTTKNLDKQPSFPNGMDKFYSYVGNNFKNPDIGEEQTITVRVSFVVEKDGSMSNIKVADDPGYGLADEAIRVLKSIKTRWSPGILDGEPVRTAYNLPISVKLE
ncbi:MAG: energy transducer TonB [Flavobacterium sp.]|nr:energy transducer TonB [Flavobacterium sp.]